MEDLFALIDCNNFYASCERVFNPKLLDRPLVILSNNDGCVIARSNEAKALGIEMGSPFFQCQPFVKSHQLQALSSNYALYGDMSHRVMDILRQMEPQVEVYSIDEAFISLPHQKFNKTQWGKHVKSLIRQYTGIPVTIGIGKTKTLAKVANKIAKQYLPYEGVLDSTAISNLDHWLAVYEVKDLWGIGWRYAKLLERHRITSAMDLKHADDTWIRKHLTVFGFRTVLELRGVSCLPLEDIPANKKSIFRSRAFGKPVQSLHDLEEAIATYTSRAAEKMRTQHLVATLLQVFITTNRFKATDRQYSNSMTIPLPTATAYTADLLDYALNALRKIYKPGYHYKKCGVMLLGLIPRVPEQMGFFDRYELEHEGLMKAVDQINMQWGSHTIQYAVAGTQKPWMMRQAQKSPAYTTKWQDIPVVRASF